MLFSYIRRKKYVSQLHPEEEKYYTVTFGERNMLVSYIWKHQYDTQLNPEEEISHSVTSGRRNMIRSYIRMDPGCY